MVRWAAGELVALALKQVTSRRRPEHPIGDTRTVTSSMPSSHTAAAVAYAVAAGVRSPRAAAPVVAGAMAVEWSRLATRRHFPTDVTVGRFAASLRPPRHVASEFDPSGTGGEPPYRREPG